MKINKYNKAKEDSSTSRTVISGSTLISSAAASEVSDEAKKLKESHLIFG
jgi:hypothetical protein